MLKRKRHVASHQMSLVQIDGPLFEAAVPHAAAAGHPAAAVGRVVHCICAGIGHLRCIYIVLKRRVAGRAGHQQHPVLTNAPLLEAVAPHNAVADHPSAIVGRVAHCVVHCACDVLCTCCNVLVVCRRPSQWVADSAERASAELVCLQLHPGGAGCCCYASRSCISGVVTWFRH